MSFFCSLVLLYTPTHPRWSFSEQSYSVRFANLAARAQREAEDSSSCANMFSAQNGDRLPYEPRGWVGASSGKPSDVLGPARISTLRKILRQRHAEQNAAQASAAAAAVAAANAAGTRGHRDHRPPCTFFLQGRCTKGSECRFSHSAPLAAAYGYGGGSAHATEDEGALGFDDNDDDAWDDLAEEEDMDYERDLFEDSKDAVLLLGEGSFEYAAAFARSLGQARRTAPSCPSWIWSHDRCPVRPPKSNGLSADSWLSTVLATLHAQLSPYEEEYVERKALRATDATQQKATVRKVT